MTKFSANLGFLWSDLDLSDAIARAKSAGFEAVEFHWPYETPAEELLLSLKANDIAALGLNTTRGEAARGEMGLSALSDRVDEARQAINVALEYAKIIEAPNVHVMAGISQGSQAYATYMENLSFACDEAAAINKTILIEPLNSRDAPGYFLNTTSQAVEIIHQLDRANLQLMFDCYHVQISEGDVTRRLQDLMPLIGHVQIAAVPDRGEPDHGELNYRWIFEILESLGFDKPIGAEYRPRGTVEDGLNWMGESR